MSILVGINLEFFLNGFFSFLLFIFSCDFYDDDPFLHQTPNLWTSLLLSCHHFCNETKFSFNLRLSLLTMITLETTGTKSSSDHCKYQNLLMIEKLPRQLQIDLLITFTNPIWTDLVPLDCIQLIAAANLSTFHSPRRCCARVQTNFTKQI